MLSTYLTYRTNAQNISQSLTRTAAQPEVSNDLAYYKANIGKVKTVDDFLSDSRLVSYATKAFGIQDMSYAKAYLRQVLTSDMSDPSSFANKLSDSRYKDFARAFNFTAGTSTDNPINIQTDAQSKDALNLYTQHITRQASAAATQTSDYKSQIATVTSVDEFLANDTLRTYALKSVGLDPSTSNAVLKQVLTGNTGAVPTSNDPTVVQAWKDLTAAFSFNADGSVSGSSGPQSASQINTMTGLYVMQANGGDTPDAATAATNYYSANIGNVSSVADLLSDRRLVSYILTSYGLDPSNVSDATLTSVLTSDPNDPSSYANTSGFDPFKSIAAAFNFQPDGSVASGSPAQTSSQQNGTTQLYQSNYNATQTAFDKSAEAYFSTNIATVKTATDLTKDPRMYQFLLTAFDIDPSSMTPEKLRDALQSDWTDASSPVNQPQNAPLKAMDRDFNFDTSGNVSAERRIQSASKILGTISNYTTASAVDNSTTAQVQADTSYYQNTISSISTLPDLLQNQKIVSILVKAYGVPANLSDTASLQKILSSDLNDPNSFVNQQGNENLRQMAAAFNFNSSGGITAEATTAPQSSKDATLTQDLFLHANLESTVGNSSKGASLALYFQRKASDIKSPYDIMADQNLLQVAQIALGLPAASGSADITQQANMITSKLNIADLQDPTKLDTFLSRFSALYDLQSAPQGANDVTTLFGGDTPGQTGISPDLLSAIQGGSSSTSQASSDETALFAGISANQSGSSTDQSAFSDSLMSSIQSLPGS